MWIMVDVEADGPCPGLFSMLSFGAVVVTDAPNPPTFYGKCMPITVNHQIEAMNVCNLTLAEVIHWPHPSDTMKEFDKWLSEVSGGDRVFFISDNNGFDWQFMNYYCWRFLGKNPFGHSSANLGSLYKGMQRDTFKNFKHLRVTKHTHNPVDDAMGNVEALLHMKKNMGLKMRL